MRRALPQIAPRVAPFLLVAAAAAIAAGCSRKPAEPVALRYMRWSDPVELAATRELLDLFEQSHPGVTVTLEFNGWNEYWPKLQTIVAAGDPPDVFMMSGLYFHDFQSRGVLADLSVRAAKTPGLALADFFAQPVASFSAQGKLHALPRDFNCIGLYYNKALFDSAGLAYPDSSWDWDDLRTAARRLTRDRDGDGRPDVWGFQVMNELETCWGNFVLQNGGRILDEERTRCMLAEPEAVEAIAFLRGLIYDDRVAPNPAELESMPGQAFRSGRVAMVTNGSWMLKSLAESPELHYGVAPLPHGRRRAAIANGVAHAVAAASKHPGEAWELAVFLSSRPAQEALARSGTSIPVLRSVATSPAYLEQGVGGAEAKRVFLDQMEYAEAIPFTPGFARWYDEVRKALDLVWIGKATPQEALASAAARADEILAGKGPAVASAQP